MDPRVVPGRAAAGNEVRPALARAVRVLAPNAGPFTLDGTNTWVVGSDPALVIDPGPADAGHLREVAGTAGTVGAILLTHRHPDHAPGAAALSKVTGAAVMSYRPRPSEKRLADGDEVRGGQVTLSAVHAPGHAEDHLVFHHQASGSMFTGDVVLGRGTSVVDPPEGDMAAYVDSLERLLALRPSVLYPGHGPAVWDGEGKLREYLEHRALRERQVLEGLRDGPLRPDDLVPTIYGEYPSELLSLAARSVLAHLLKLEREGRVTRVKPGRDVFVLHEDAPADGDRTT